MKKVTSILLFYDGTNIAKLALVRCLMLSQVLAAKVAVLSVLDTEKMNANCGGLLTDVAIHQLETTERKCVEEAVDVLRKAGITACGHFGFGSVVQGIVEKTRELKADWVVVGNDVQVVAKRLWWFEKKSLVSELTERLAGVTLVAVSGP
jgi:nucleotide-binding universal stress UspA family protein